MNRTGKQQLMQDSVYIDCAVSKLNTSQTKSRINYMENVPCSLRFVGAICFWLFAFEANVLFYFRFFILLTNLCAPIDCTQHTHSWTAI